MSYLSQMTGLAWQHFVAGELDSRPLNRAVTIGTFRADNLIFAMLLVAMILLVGAHVLSGGRTRSDCRASATFPAQLTLPMQSAL
jgi:K+-transporting ATPase A subunit